MQGRHAVYCVCRYETKRRHFNLAVLEYGVFGDLIVISGINAPQFVAVTAVNLAHNLEYSRQQSLKQLLRPFFERLRHNRMIRITYRVAGNLPRPVPTVAVLVQKNPHKFGYAQRGVRIVDMNCGVLGKVVERRISL